MNLRKLAYTGKFVQKGFIILWASAIIWFYLGNLVNFHQNRIWGKLLIPACFTHSSVNNKDFGSLLNSESDSFSSILDVNLDIVSHGAELQITPAELDVEVQIFIEDVIPSYSAHLTGTLLRGPPIA